jgi:ubiquinone/menaquinone biosynthesis C-methylase UbiE
MKKQREREERIKKFFNERIIRNGQESFSNKINLRNDSEIMILNFLKKQIDPKKKVLDMGCGEGRFSRYFIEKGTRIYSIDFSEEYIKICKNTLKNGRFKVGSITNIPFKNDNFDYIFCVDVLQHVPKLEKAIHELKRVLKKDGIIIIIDKNKFGLHKRYLIPEIFIQKYKELTETRYNGFKEQWFNPKRFNTLLKTEFKNSEYDYLIEKNKSIIFKIIPQLNWFVSWKARK